jgi:hypothetical protein
MMLNWTEARTSNKRRIPGFARGAMLVAGRLILLVDNVCRSARPGPINHRTRAASLSASRSWGAPRQCDPPTRARYWDVN